jgi:hypothetical protein
MPNLHAIALIGAFLIAATTLMVWTTTTMNRKDAEVITGFVGGVPVPRGFRWWTLLQIELPIAFFTFGFALLMAFVFRQIGHTVENPEVRYLADACSALYLGGAGMYFLAGAVGVSNVISGRSRRAIYRSASLAAPADPE